MMKKLHIDTILSLFFKYFINVYYPPYTKNIPLVNTFLLLRNTQHKKKLQSKKGCRRLFCRKNFADFKFNRNNSGLVYFFSLHYYVSHDLSTF